MKKIIHKLAIETPVIVIVLVSILCLTLVKICGTYQVDKYIEITSIPQKQNEEMVVVVNVEKRYLDGIQKLNNVIWFENLDSAVYKGEIIDIEVEDENLIVVVKINEKDYSKGKEVTLKISYDKENIMERLFKKN